MTKYIKPRKLWYVTVRYPTGTGEEFLQAEIRALERIAEVTVVPLRAVGRGGPFAGLLGARALVGAVRTLARHPLLCIRAAIEVLGTEPRNAIRNLAVLPRALDLAGRVPPDTWLHAAWATTPATACLVMSSISGSPWAFSAHRHDVAARNLLVLKGRSASVVRAISERTASDLRSAGVDARKIAVVHLGVDLPARAVELSERPLVVLSPGALVPRKNQRVLIAALSDPTAAHLRLVLAGDGPDRSSLEQFAAEIGVSSRVDFMGHIAHDALLDLYRRDEVRVVSLASMDEGIPVALMESLAHGIPVVASAVGGVTELVEERVGVLVDDPSDVNAFAQAMATTAGWNPATVWPIARAIIESRFDATANASLLADLMWPERQAG